MQSCVCNAGKVPIDGCQDLSTSIECTTPTDSRRSVKDEITYVDDAERAALANEALAIPLATYRYKREPEGARRHLGFIIDDQPATSPAVDAQREHVDLYGYATMLLAATQEQDKEIRDLRARLDAVERRAARCDASRSP
jgi:hypothetical protein